VVVQAYKFLSNEYRYFPIRFQMNICDIYNKNMAGIGFPKCRNYQSCPVETERFYEICNFTPDESKFPPLIPSGRYMLELTGVYFSDEVWKIHMLGEVSRPIVKK
ncbi:hypothetical protein ILUMI_20157, partial [Ignelater luminosus]